MFSYGLLEIGCYYLVQEKKDSPLTLIKVATESDHCMYILRYEDTLASEWKKKTDGIIDIVECLTDDAVRAWEKQYNSEDAYYEEDEE
ncbi:MAG: hypothetical protein H0V30_05330 [Chitinophagaceae bacterium]|jgi:hypothetical protein|nr:hypothetical protein [Chitinophagaceae bacterium]